MQQQQQRLQLKHNSKRTTALRAALVRVYQHQKQLYFQLLKNFAEVCFVLDLLKKTLKFQYHIFTSSLEKVLHFSPLVLSWSFKNVYIKKINF